MKFGGGRRQPPSGNNSLIQADIGGAAGHELEILVRNVAADQWVAEDFIL